MEDLIREGRSLEETPTWSVATVTTVMVFVCLLVERSIYRFGKWLKKTRRKALFASLERIKEVLKLFDAYMLLPMTTDWASWISQICLNSSILSHRFYICSEEEYGINEKISFTKTLSSLNETDIPPRGLSHPSYHQCGEGREPFVSYEGLEQLHRFLFVLGITHVLYSCIAVGLAMSKIYSWRKWENQASLALDANLQDASMEALWHPVPEFGHPCCTFSWHSLPFIVILGGPAAGKGRWCTCNKYGGIEDGQKLMELAFHSFS
ncbi:seven transmembrane MLO family protein [Actinidia rufa]|uniref:Seven transmembrane MLO family protein n=1 Tax=Actinidia rufa TaxID=165716 RepID=A0A7J0ESQ2_9ERIC|nr:seven transmembrane MLO family protein [Actinidia rufa]